MDRNFVAKTFTDAFSSRSSFEMEYRRRNFMGNYSWIVDRGSPFYTGHKFAGYVGWATDITEQKRALNKARMQSVYIRLIAEISDSLHQARSEKQGLYGALKKICQELRCPVAEGGLWDSHSRRRLTLAKALYVLQGKPRNLVAAFNSAISNSTLLNTVLRARTPVAIPVSSWLLPSQQKEVLRVNGIKTLISVPVFLDGTPAGTITFASSRDFDPMLKIVIKSVGLGVEQLIVRLQTERALETMNQQYRAFFEQTSVGAAQALPDGRFIKVNRSMKDITGYSRKELVRMRLNDFMHANDREAEQQFCRLFRGDISGCTVESRIVRKNSERAVVQVDATLIRDKAGKPLCIAAIFQDVTARKQADDAFRSANHEVQMLVARLNRAQEEERARIARELHDSIGQVATGLSLSIASLQDSIMQIAAPGKPVEGLEQKLRKLRASSSELVRNIRKLSHGLHPAVLELAGLVSSLRALCDEFRKQESMKIELKVDPGVEVQDKEVALGLYRIVQEALRNIRKHAKSPAVAIHLSANKRALRLTIKDFGVGFDPSAVRERAGLGIISMQERAHILGGVFRIAKNPQRGTEVTIVIPQKRNSSRLLPSHSVAHTSAHSPAA